MPRIEPRAVLDETAGEAIILAYGGPIAASAGHGIYSGHCFMLPRITWRVVDGAIATGED
jgi:hypothetical protein